MHKSFLILFLLSLLGVLGTCFFAAEHEGLQWAGVIFGIIPLIIYQFVLSRKNILSTAEVDSVYYFGFLVTIVTLVSTAISIGIAKQLPDIQWILRQFGFGLVATGYALFARLWLLEKSSGLVEMDIVEATAKLVGSISAVSKQFDEAGYDSVEFVKTLKSRLEELLNESDARLTDSLRITLDSIKKTNSELVEGTISRSSEIIDQATNKFSKSISQVMEEVVRIHTEAQAISFKKASEKIVKFSDEIESSLLSITNKTSEVSVSASEGINELMITVEKVQNLALAINNNMSNLSGINGFIGSISKTAETIGILDKTLESSNRSLLEFSNKSAMANIAISKEVIEPLASLKINNSLKKIAVDITSSATYLNESFFEVKENAKKLSNAFNENIRILEDMRTSDVEGKVIQNSVKQMASEIELLKVEFSDLGRSISELKSMINSFNKVVDAEIQKQII